MGATLQFATRKSAQVRHPDPRLVRGQFEDASAAARSRPAEDASRRWLVDLHALSLCRALFAGRGVAETDSAGMRAGSLGRQLILMDVPPAYDLFCHTHFASVKRVHPEFTWEDACPAYAIALSAHASLHVALDEARERQLEHCWDEIRGDSRLQWSQARPLIADGCSALDRLDPLAMRR